MKMLIKPLLVGLGLHLAIANLSAQYFAAIPNPLGEPDTHYASHLGALPALREGDLFPSRNFLFAGVFLDPFHLNATNLDVFIRDASPQPQTFTLGADLEDIDRVIGGIIGFGFPVADQYLATFDFSFAGTGDTYTGSVLIGAAYRLGGSRFVFAPGAKIGGGGGNIRLGAMRRLTPFIQIANQQFLGDEVKVNLREYYLAIQPEASLFFAINDRIAIKLNAGYRLAARIKERAVFSGYDDSANTNSVKAKLKLSDDSISFFKNGANSEKSGLQYFSGIKAEIGLTFTLGNN